MENKLRSWIMLSIPLAAIILMGTTKEKVLSKNADRLVSDMNLFCFKILHMEQQKAKNVIFSPKSIFQAFALLESGAEGETRQQLSQALYNEHISDKQQKQFNADILALNEELRESAAINDDTTLNMKNILWLDGKYVSFKKSFMDNATKYFNTEIKNISLQNGQAAAKAINECVSRETNNMIDHIVSSEDFKSRSSPGVINEPGLVLIDIIYFKSKWASRFNSRETELRDFSSIPGETHKVNMMYQNSLLRYAENMYYKLLIIDYKEDQYSMRFLMPKRKQWENNNVPEVSWELLSELVDNAYVCKVDVMIPKFSIETNFDLKEQFFKLGVENAFDQKKADFDKIFTRSFRAIRIYCQQAFHRAKVEIDEEGSKASAETCMTGFSIGCAISEMPLPNADFHADHPFYFFICHNRTGAILFAGRIANP